MRPALHFRLTSRGRKLRGYRLRETSGGGPGLSAFAIVDEDDTPWVDEDAMQLVDENAP